MITKARETTQILTVVSHFSRLQSSVSVAHRKQKNQKSKIFDWPSLGQCSALLRRSISKLRTRDWPHWKILLGRIFTWHHQSSYRALVAQEWFRRAMHQATAHLFISIWHLIFKAHICTCYGNNLCKFDKNPSTQQQCTKFLFTKEKKSKRIIIILNLLH